MRERSTRWFVRREVVLPSFRTLAIFFVILAIGVWVSIRSLYPFLATTNLPSADTKFDVLCVEGWAPENVMEAVAEFDRQNPVELIMVTGGPVQSRERLFGVESYAELGALRLGELGIESEKIRTSIPDFFGQRRTLHDIMECQETILSHGSAPDHLLIVSSNVHTRRTALLYRRVFGSNVEIWSLAIAPEGYDPTAWWRTSEGLKTVLMESVSLIYDWVSPTDPESLTD